MSRLPVTVLASLLLTSCYEPPAEGYTISFDFAGLTAEEVPHVEVYVLEECSGSNVLGPDDNVLGQVGFEMDADPQPAELPITRTGTYGLLAVGSTRDCSMVSSVCRTVTFEDFVVGGITLRLNPHPNPLACDWPSTCSENGVCDQVTGASATPGGCMANNQPSGTVAVLEAGENHTCVLFEGGSNDGEVFCWGDNSLRQLNDSSTLSYPQPIWVNGAKTELHVGGNLTCAGSLSRTDCWGNGERSMGGLSASYPGRFDVAPTHACRMHEGDEQGDRLRCWGDNADGQFWDDFYSTTLMAFPGLAIVPEDTRWVATGGDADGGFTCIASATTVACAGDGPGSQSATHSPLAWDGTNITEISAGADHACIVDDGALYCWGDNTDGQLGIETFGVGLDLPTRVGLADDWETVSAGGNTTCGIRSGELYCWGANPYGQAGTGPVPTRLPRKFEGAGGWSRVAVGSRHACGQQLGLLRCWGNGDSHQLGSDRPAAQAGSFPSPQQVCFP